MTTSTERANREPPIFVIGCARSGTTILFRMLAEHPRLAWISNWSNRFPGSDLALHAARLRHAPLLRSLGDQPVRPRPVEGYAPWLRCLSGFNRPVRDLRADDVDDAGVERLRALAERHCAVQRRPRFAAKYTGWSRIGLMDRAFPGARYLHVVRDGRAVAASLLRVGFWEGWRGPEQWRWGPLGAEDAELWQRSERSFSVLAGLQWKILARSIRATGLSLGERYREVRYEDFVADRDGLLGELAGWAELPPDPHFTERLKQFSLRSADDKWREQLSPAEARRLEDCLEPTLAEFGYGG